MCARTAQVELYAVLEDAAHIYLVMEHCSGGDLFKHMNLHGGCLEEAWVSSQVGVPPSMLLPCQVERHRRNEGTTY